MVARKEGRQQKMYKIKKRQKGLDKSDKKRKKKRLINCVHTKIKEVIYVNQYI